MTNRLRRLVPPLVAAALAALVLASIAGASHDGIVRTDHLNECTTAPALCVIVNNHATGGTALSASSDTGTAVHGIHSALTGIDSGVLGVTNSTAALATGVYGEAPGNGSLVTGVYGGATHGIGLLGFGGNIALAAVNPNGGLAGYFGGHVYVNGTLAKAAGAFRIDHPLDPANKYLQHSFVESPDMKNVYDGVARTDLRGFATVRLPRYFSALNRSFRYQLTSLSGLQNVAVARKIKGNRFVIQSEKPRSEVSWQVTGIRKDRYANEHRIDVEIAKTAADRRDAALASRLQRARK